MNEIKCKQCLKYSNLNIVIGSVHGYRDTWIQIKYNVSDS